MAERDAGSVQASEWLTFIVVGGGPTGVELAGALGEIARYTLRGNFKHIDPAQARILLVEGVDRLLPGYPPQLSAYAAQTLATLGVIEFENRVLVLIQWAWSYITYNRSAQLIVGKLPTVSHATKEPMLVFPDADPVRVIN